jgi:hypothetical protein
MAEEDIGQEYQNVPHCVPQRVALSAAAIPAKSHNVVNSSESVPLAVGLWTP